MLLKNREATPKSRIKLLVLMFLALTVLVVLKLFTWQVVKSEELIHQGLLQQKSSKEVGASRGSILAADGYPLAVSSAGWVIWANPGKIKDAKDTSEKLAPILLDKEPGSEKEASSSSAQMTQEDKQKIEKEKLEAEKERLWTLLAKKGAWVPLKHKIDNTTKLEIEQLNIEGLGFDAEDRRTYPEGSMAAHLLGFVGKDAAGNDKGYFGLEGKYNVALSGVGGEKVWEKDALGNPILSGISKKIAALDGVDLQTNIDRTVQYLIDKHLKEGVEKYGAANGTVIVMRPKDGAILGMAAYPNYSPSQFSKYKQEDFINPAISQTFEPGSIFKVLVMAGALDAKAVTLDDRCDICAHAIQIGQYTIRTWDDHYHPDSTPGEIIKNSDNTGMVWAAQRLGADKLYDYLANFGIGSQTGIDLQGETTPSMRPKGKWGQVDLATTGFGQGIAVTPIQMVRAVGAIANGGRLPTPQVTQKVIGKDWEEAVKPSLGKNVISPEAARQITDMMVYAVSQGEAKWAAPKGFLIAGKTGTAQIPIAGHYDPNETNASFIGFAPADNPQFVMMVTLHQPTSSPWAAETAAPLWFNISKELFVYFGIQPTE